MDIDTLIVKRVLPKTYESICELLDAIEQEGLANRHKAEVAKARGLLPNQYRQSFAAVAKKGK